METPPQEFLLFTDSDRPVTDVGADEFGFVEIAKRLAPALIQAIGQDGLVIGIEGVWGSGKTSLINYVQKEVAAEGSVEIISLAPWLSGDEDSLVETLLGQIAESIERRDQPRGLDRVKSWWRSQERGSLPILLKKYGSRTGRVLSPVLKVGGLFVPGMSAAAEITEIGSKALEGLGKNPTNAQLKEAISKRLKNSSGRYLVVLDDLDRLEPAQAVEVIRLVRSVADFPNILYLMCYDRRVLAHALQRGLGVEDGDIFLRKIVQQTFSIPLPEPFDLRINFLGHAAEHFQGVNRREMTLRERQDLQEAVSNWGRRLRTPRDVKLVLNGVRFHYAPVKDQVNFADVCRVQLMRVVEPAIYLWLEEYLGVMSVIATNDGRADKVERVEMGKRYAELFSGEPDSSPSRWTMKQLVPGLDKIDAAEVSGLVYGNISQTQLREFVDGKRLGSPFHYRYYFALAPARTVLPQVDYDRVMGAALQGSEQVRQALAELYHRRREIGGNWLSQFFNRLDSFTANGYSTAQIRNLMLGIVNLMDEVLCGRERADSHLLGPARQGEEAIKQATHALALTDPEEAQKTVLDVMKNGAAVTWIVGYLMRSELHRHGLPKAVGKKKPEEEWLLNSQVFEYAISCVRDRAAQYAHENPIESSPDLPALLFGWRDLGGEGEAKVWVQANITDEKRFVDFLLRMRSWAMSDAVCYPLYRKSLECFIDVTDLDAKLKRIADEHPDLTVRDAAKTAIEALTLGEHFA